MIKKWEKGKYDYQYTYEYVKYFFEKNGCKLLSTEYKNARTHLDYICKCGNKTRVVFDSFRHGRHCRKCGTKIIGDKQTYSYKYVKRYI